MFAAIYNLVLLRKGAEVDWLEVAGQIVGLLASLGVLAGLAYAARYYWSWRRWSRFASLVERWAKGEHQSFRLDERARPDDDVFRSLVVN